MITVIPSPRIVVTGMAWTTPLGNGLDCVWDQLLAGQTGIQPVPHPGRLRNNSAAAVPSLAAELSPANRLLQMACNTAVRAVEAAGHDFADDDLRLVLGTSLGAYLEDAPSRSSLSGWVDDVGQAVGVSSPAIAVSTACSSGSDAILIGAEMIRGGAARCCVCGGVDVLTWSKRIAHSSLGTLSPSVLRAFDVRHDGTILGEGAGFMVLEAAPSRRDPIAFFRGAGSANDATGMTAPDADGLGARYAIERSLTDAQVHPEAVGLINAHGSGTPLNDRTEGIAFRKVFGGPELPLVFATKGNFGHSLGATGAIEAIALILALRSGRVPPIVGLEQPDPEFSLPLALGDVVPCEARIGLSLTLGFGGFDTSLIFEGVR